MARIDLAQATGLTAADVIHSQFSALPASATIGEVRDWFAASSSRRMAVLVDGERYAGSLTPERLGGELDPSRPATDVALDGPTVPPGAPAKVGQDIALRTAARRVPVVDEDGRLLGVIAVTSDLKSFCGTGGTPTI